jgi:hypothetical protein
MDVYIQIHRPAEALNDRDRTAAAVHDPSHVSHVAQETEHGPNGNTHHPSTLLGMALSRVEEPQLAQAALPLHENGTSRSSPQ